MRRRISQVAATAFAGVFAVLGSAPVLAQQASTSAGSGARPRSTDERVNAETATPPPVNSDYRRAAEGTLPIVPGGAVPTTGPASDPAGRPIFANRGIATTNPSMNIPSGLDVALLIGHAVEMGIDGSTLSSLAQGNKPDEQGNDSVKALLAHAQDEMRTSKELLSKAAAAGSAIDANSPIRKFYASANNYMAALSMLSTPGTSASPNDKAMLATINHSVKSVMDANHMLQLGGGSTPSPALDTLLGHARTMKDEGLKALDQMAGTNPIDPNSPPSPTILAQRGRELLDAAGQVAPMMNVAGYGPNGYNGAMNGLINSQGPNPGRLQDTRPEIIGGTYGTGSQTAGTATGAEAARNIKNSTEGPGGTLNVPTPNGAPGSGTSSYGVGNNNTPPTQSTAGPRPR